MRRTQGSWTKVAVWTGAVCFGLGLLYGTMPYVGPCFIQKEIVEPNSRDAFVDGRTDHYQGYDAATLDRENAVLRLDDAPHPLLP
jgi:hypothetical protein